jgi:hypothetical protein
MEVNQNNIAGDVDKENLFSDISSSFSRSRSHSRNSKEDKLERSERTDEDKRFIMKNGCCRDCMRAFSKTGKSCLCQVPKYERKYTLPEKGCNFCGCHGNELNLIIGCNPVDVRREKRKELKKQLREDKNILYKKQRLLDSDDEDLKIYHNDVDEWNKLRKEFIKFIGNNVSSSTLFMGIGVPLRTPSYILGKINVNIPGYQPYNESDVKKKKPYKRRNSSKTPERDNN